MAGVDDLGDRLRDLVLEVGGGCDHVALGVVHRDSMKSLTVSEPVHKAFQLLPGTRLDQGDDRFPQALVQKDHPPLQFGDQARPLLPDLVEGGTDGDQRDHERKRHDEPDRDLHADSLIVGVEGADL
jgi:hypothetical protein